MGVCDARYSGVFSRRFLCMNLIKKITVYLLAVSVLFSDFVLPTKPIMSILPKHVQEGDTVFLSCRTAENDEDPTLWHSPGKQEMSFNCEFEAFHKQNPRITLSGCDREYGWFNYTIKDIQWSDKGIYSCINKGESSIDIDVLVPQKINVNVSVVKGRNYGDSDNSTSWESDVIDMNPDTSKDTEIELECTTGCSNPQPILKWYRAINGERPEYIPKNKYNTEMENCSDGLVRLVSVLTLLAVDMPPGKQHQNITCESQDNFTAFQIGLLPKIQHMEVQFGVKEEKEQARMGNLQSQPLNTLEITGIAVGSGITLLLLLLGVACFLWSRARDDARCVDPDAKEKMNVTEERV